MTEKKKTKTDEILEKLKNIEEKIEKLKKDPASDEDQLFFGIAFGLLILLISFNTEQIASFLDNLFGIGHDIAMTNAGYIRYIGIMFFLASSITRYATVVSSPDNAKSKKYRYISFETLWLGLNIIIFTIMINLVTPLSQQIGPLGISSTFVVLAIVFSGINLLERVMLKQYSSKDAIPETYAVPFASLINLSIVVSACVGIIEEVFAILLGFGPMSTIRFLLVYMIASLVVLVLALKKMNRKQRTKDQVQSNIKRKVMLVIFSPSFR